MKTIFTISTHLLFLLNIGFSQIQLQNDEFADAATLQANWLNINDEEGWNAEHLEVHNINTSSTGELYMMPFTSSWYQDYRGTLIYKNIDQNFVLTTEVSVTNRSGTGLPSSTFSLAGLMIRSAIDYPNGALTDWLPNQENYIFLAAGYASGGSGPHFEVKNTVNGSSSLAITTIPTVTNVQIRVARIDGAVIVLYRLPSQNWIVHRRYARNDFPAEIQIGFVTYTDWPKVSSYDEFFQNSHVLNSSLNPDPTAGVPFNPDLIGRFDFARFDNVTVPLALNGVDLVTQASNDDLLSFLGYTSDMFCPSSIHVADIIVPGQIAEMNVVDELTADNLIETNAMVHYRAGNGIVLEENFNVDLGGSFSAEIANCN